MIVSNGVWGFNSKVIGKAGLILQSLQLQAQLILATLGCHKVGERLFL